MSESRELYQLLSTDFTEGNLSRINFILQRIADRLDKIEGVRGDSVIESDLDLSGNSLVNVNNITLAGEISVDISNYVLIRDEKAANTGGGSFTQGAWQTRDLNTEVSDDGNNATLSSNQITLLSGTYRCIISCPAYAVNRHKARLRNITDSTTTLIGSSEYASFAGPSQSRSFIKGTFTITSSKTFEVQHRCQSTSNTVGYGVESNFSETEIYTIAEFWKIS